MNHVHCVYMARHLWEMSAAKKWLSEHKIIPISISRTKNYYRFRITKANDNKYHYLPKQFNIGIILVIFFVKEILDI